MKKLFHFMPMRLLICAILFGLSFMIPKHNSILLGIIYIALSYDLYLEWFRQLKSFQIFDERFLMIIATLGAFVIGENLEAVAVMLFYQIGEYLSEQATEKSKDAITKLMDIRVDTAHVVGKDTLVLAKDVTLHTHILVQPGERIPLDGIVVKGESYLDTSSMTGESAPKKVSAGDSILSGCVNQSGVLEIEVTKEFQNSTVSRILELMEQASEQKTKQEKFITKFAKIYTPVIVLSALLVTIIPVIFLDQPFMTWLYRSLTFLVISCPCALVVSVPLGFFCGIGTCSKRGILVKSSSVIETIDQIDTVIFDKTGTLTKGVFQIQKVIPLYGTKEQVLHYAAIGEIHSNHPIAKCIINTVNESIETSDITDYQELAGKGTRTIYQEHEILVGNQTLFMENNIVFPKIELHGTLILVAVDHEYLGTIVIADEMKETSLKTIQYLKQKGIEVVMLSGDQADVVKEIGSQLGLDACYANLLPTDKVELVKEYQNNHPVLFIGDGMNDAPVLMQADLGISMGGIGSDAAIEASDCVFMYDEPGSLLDLMKISSGTKRIVKMNIILAIGLKILILGFGLFGLASMWVAVFADVGVTLLTILNSLRIFVKYR